MKVYYDFPSSDTTSINVAFEEFREAAEVNAHFHRYYEFALITRGSCIHRFRDVEVPLIAGDVFIIPPEEEHSYRIMPHTTIANCYFFPELLGTAFSDSIIPNSLHDIKNQWDEILINIASKPGQGDPIDTVNPLSRQGILHLAPSQAMDVESLLRRIQSEHSNLLYESEYMKSAILLMILVIFKREQLHMPQKQPAFPESKKHLIMNSLNFLEENFSRTLTIKEIANASSLSESYFRTVFRDVTGLSPLDYLNRLRMVKAMIYMQGDGLSVADAAAKVGILDANYFSRLFKKTIGYSPKHFKTTHLKKA